MKLKKLELYGFKSFMDRTEIVFDQGSTGIVGPNGSGKSNIGDAVRWVLGEQSPRILRGARMEDVIFGGTQKRKRASYCEVSLTFDNSDGTLKSSFSEVCVTRRVYRSGDSEYQLNKANCRLKDIQELFRDTGIGREGYSLIGQGRIDEILSQKSEDRRQVFEEAAGIMTYRVRKEEAERKLARTGENLTRVYDILNEIEGRLETLKRESDTARKYQVLYEKLKALEVNIFLVRYDKNIRRTETLRQTMEGLKDVLLSGEAKLNEYSSQRQELEEEIEKLEEALSHARLLHSGQLEQTHRAEVESERLKGRVSQLKASGEEAGRQLDETRTALKELSGAAPAGAGEEALRAEADAAEAALEEAQTILQNRLALEQAAETALDRHKAGILAAANRQSDVRDRQTRQLTIRSQMEDRLRETEASIAELEAQQMILTDQVEQDRAAVESAEDSLALSRENASRAQENLALLSQKAQNLANEAQTMNLHLQADRSRLRLMEEMAREMTGYQQSVKKALEFAGRDTKVHGVLARLISVPQKLETAIDMVLGGALQNIVTDDEETAKKVIDYLRANRLGRATFLPITSVRSRVLNAEERKALNMPGCLGVASELISYDPRYRGVVENLLGRTVIADDLEHGIPIMRAGRHAFRLVTLAGDVMHSGGSMTGGTTQNRSVSLLGREREIKDLRSGIGKRTAELEALQQALEQASEAFEAAQAGQESLTEELHQKEILLARETEHYAGSRNDLKNIEERLEKTRQGKAQLEAGIGEIDRELAEFQSTVQSASTDREEMEKKTDALQAEMLARRAQTDEQREAAAALQLKLTEARHALDTFLREEARRKDETARLTAQAEKLSAQRRAYLDEAKGLQEELNRAEEALNQLREENRTSLEEVNRLEQLRAQKSAGHCPLCISSAPSRDTLC